MPTRIVLDVDTGVDDAVALAFAVIDPRIELVAVTCVNGNVGAAQRQPPSSSMFSALLAMTDGFVPSDLDHVCENTLRLLEHVGAASVPVYRGMRAGITRDVFPNGDPMNDRIEQSKVHGAYLPLPEATVSVQEEDAVSFLGRTFLEVRAQVPRTHLDSRGDL